MTEKVSEAQILIDDVRRAEVDAPPQWFPVPSNTFFKAGALENLRELDCETVVIVTDAQTVERGVVDLLRTKLPTKHVHVFARLIFEALPRAYRDPDDLEARTQMSHAATLAGLAFSNAFVGTNHALAHAVGAAFGIPHGRANGVFLTHVLRYNASLPSKFMPAPGYSAYIAPAKYAQLGALIFGGHDEQDSRARLFAGVEELLDALDMPRTLRDCGVDEQEFLDELPELAMTAFEDLSNHTNPRMPMVAEITELLRAGYYGQSL